MLGEQAVGRRARGRGRPTSPAGAAAVAVVALALALGALARVRGAVGFPTHPAALAALAVAAVHLAVRPGTSRARPVVLLTGVALGLYALLGSAASAVTTAPATSAAGTAAAALAALWGAAWLPPLVCASAAAVLARSDDRRWSATAWVLLVLGAATTAATALVQEPVVPFAGLPTAAPAAWRTHGGPVLDVLSLLLLAVLVAVPVALLVSALGRPAGRSVPGHRARGVVLALGAASPLVVVTVCLLLALARDPGGVDPSVGSTGFLVVLAAGCWASGRAALAGSADDAHRPALTAARCASAAVVVIAVLTAGVLAAAALDGAPALVVVAVTGLVAAAGLEVWRRSARWAETLVGASDPPPAPPTPATTTAAAPLGAPPSPRARAPQPAPPPPAPAPAPPPARWSELTRREREVLAVLATGASNAAIAAALAISPRTVEAHLRSVFTRLRLDPGDGANRRVVVARFWMEHGPRS